MGYPLFPSAPAVKGIKSVPFVRLSVCVRQLVSTLTAEPTQSKTPDLHVFVDP